MAAAAGKFDEAAIYQEESLILRRKLGDTWGIANLLSNMAEVAYERGRLTDAEAMAEESLQLRQGIGDRNGQALVYPILGGTARTQGRMAEATAYHLLGIELGVEVGNEGATLANIEGLAVIAGLNGQALEALRLLGAVEALRMDSRGGLTPIDQLRLHRSVEEVRALYKAGDPSQGSLDSAWVVGRTFTFERALREIQSLFPSGWNNQL